MSKVEEMSISIIVPVYNAECFLRRCIRSIENQSYSNYEVILINDGSTDGSEAICLDYANRDPRVRYVKQENQGVSATRNKGFHLAKGQYITLLDNDDCLNTNSLEMIAKHAVNNPDVIIMEYRDVSTDEDIERILSTRFENVNTWVINKQAEFLQKEMFCPREEKYKGLTMVFPWGRAYRRGFLIDNELQFDPRIKLCEDVYFNLKLYEKTEKVQFVNYPSYLYFKNVESAGKRFNPSVVAMETNNISILDEYVFSKERDKDYYLAYDNCRCFRYWSCCFAYFVHPQNKKSIFEIIDEMKQFETNTDLRKSFRDLPKLRQAMELKEWLFLMAIKFNLYLPILFFSRSKMKRTRRS